MQMEMIDLLRTRRSVLARNMIEPGPDRAALETILEIAARVPDHGKLVPWRFIVLEGSARRAFGEVVAQQFARNTPAAGARAIGAERDRFARAPLVVAVVSRADADARIPEWEQILSAGAVCQNMLVAAAALGFAGQWLTAWYAYDREVLNKLGLSEDERIAGYIFLGTAANQPDERPRPALDDIVTRWTPPTPQ